MHLLLTVTIPNEVAMYFEEDLYFISGLSWETQVTEEKTIFKFYFPLSLDSKDEEKLSTLEKLTAKFDSAVPEYTLIKRENWEIIWKYHFKPLKVGKKLLILPPWEKASLSSEEEIVIYIDPGQAFGTGHHATTQLMLENLESFLEEITKIKEAPLILDLGCGTGILSIAAAKLCPKATIYAVDIDELALEATEKNAKLNHIWEQIKIASAIPEEINIKFDLILANIGFRELKSLAPSFPQYCLSKETLLLLSGVLREDLPELEKVYISLGFQKLKSQFLKEWSLLALRAP